MKKRIALLGSTGSIGKQTLDVVDWFPDRLEVVALTARTDAETLRAQVERYRPRFAALSDPPPGAVLETSSGRIHRGSEALVEAATLAEADLVIISVVGTAGLAPALAALEAGKDVALATKEALVVGGHLMTEAARRSGATILPIDSEHSAIWQCLRGNEPTEVERVVLTASGGPFVDKSRAEMEAATIEKALDHPTWNMGGKITIDSATLMNKGLEVIEAKWLFGLSADRIEVVVHRQSIIHSLVYFRDSSVMAQMGVPDMRLPIQYSLFYPERLPNTLERLDLVRCRNLTFEAPDLERFPALGLAFQAAEVGGSLPGVMSGANEAAVDLFLAGRIPFPQIAERVQRVMEAHPVSKNPGLEEILHADAWARSAAVDGA
ncbi:MAG TPA: 1-deoxy-D-xylulose-5-phosphate reductoisomerase [Armatimonadota bacterium]|nr:1-deoxy-D-xylulose-5-phosphate reductoisomerase [Armatimonadota bacterium]